jgi:hypothetical protein
MARGLIRAYFAYALPRRTFRAMPTSRWGTPGPGQDRLLGHRWAYNDRKVILATLPFAAIQESLSYAQSQEILQYSTIAVVCLTSPNGNPTIYFDLEDLSNQFLSCHTISWGGGMVMKSGMKPDIPINLR